VRLAVALASLLLAGCVTGREAFHALHLVDVAQTSSSVALGPCHEADTITSALIGREPSLPAVAAWGAAVAIGFELVRELLPERWVPLFEWASVAAKAVTVVRNELEGCGL
jgi:hypothetical protein